MSDINKTLEQRGNVHGDFSEQSVAFKNLMMGVIKHTDFKFCGRQAEIEHAITMIMIKMSRILTGDASFPDHWHDIAGYATLVERILEVDQKFGDLDE